MEHNKGAKTMSTPTLEERVAVLETKVEELKLQGQDTKGEEPHGWQRIFGRFAGMPGFEESVQLGREWRESQEFPIDEEDE
jgi:hypothetical protein